VELAVLSRFADDLRYGGASILIISPIIYLLCHPVLKSKVHSQEKGVGHYAKSGRFSASHNHIGTALYYTSSRVPACHELKLRLVSPGLDVKKFPSEKCPRTEKLRGPINQPHAKHKAAVSSHWSTRPEPQLSKPQPLSYTNCNLPNE
jgi:hypothetical protein